MKISVIFTLSFILALSAFSGGPVFATLDGDIVTLEEILSEEKAVLLFWTTWCPRCVKELGRFDKDPILIEGIKIYYVNTGETAWQVEKWLTRRGFKQEIQENIILDKDLILADKFSVQAIPVYIFLRDGESIKRTHLITERMIREAFKDE